MGVTTNGFRGKMWRDWYPILKGDGYGYVANVRMIDPERDEMYSRVFATPEGRLVLDDMRRDDPELVRLIEGRCDRMRRRYEGEDIEWLEKLYADHRA